MRSFAVEGTVFLLVVSAISSVILVIFPGSAFIAMGIVFAAVYLVLAYFCWKLSTWGFIATVVLSMFVIVADVSVSQLQYAGDEFLVVIQLLTILFAFRGYRELTGDRVASKE